MLCLVLTFKVMLADKQLTHYDMLCLLDCCTPSQKTQLHPLTSTFCVQFECKLLQHTVRHLSLLPRHG